MRRVTVMLDSLERPRKWMKRHPWISAGAAYLVLAFGVAYAIQKRHEDQQATNGRFLVSQVQQNDLFAAHGYNAAINRAVLAETSCEGINKLAAAGLQVSSRLHRQLELPRENCPQLVHEALLASVQHPVLSPRSHPLTWMAVQRYAALLPRPSEPRESIGP